MPAIINLAINKLNILKMKQLYILAMVSIACTLNGHAQNIEDRITNQYGVTHHTLNENKIQLMKSANFAIENIKKYQRKRNLGLCVAGAGAGVFYYACSHMEIPVKFEGRDNSEYDRTRRRRIAVGAAGVALMGTGAFLVVKNDKLLRNAEVMLQPDSGGVRFYF